jgi:hypothetical protein
LLSAWRTASYVVERGLTAITVAGTVLVAGAVVRVQPKSAPGVQAGRLGLICCVSVGGVDGLTTVGMLM